MMGKRAKATLRTINYAKGVVKVGDKHTTREILDLMMENNIPPTLMPRSTNQLSARLKTHPHFVMEQLREDNLSLYTWRRVE